MLRNIFITTLLFLSVLSTGCMSLVNGATSLVGAAAGTTATAVKAGGTMLKDAATGTMDYTSSAWKQASIGSAPEPQEPPLEP